MVESTSGEVKQTITEIMNLNPESVIIFAMVGDRIHWSMSSAENRLELIGALEIAKAELIKEE